MDITPRYWNQSIPPKPLGSMHKKSKEIIFPPVAKDSPLDIDYVNQELNPNGTLYSFTVIHPSKKSGIQPYAIGFVNLPDFPVRIFGRLVQSGSPAIGDKYLMKPDAEFGHIFEKISQ
jgi:uncharacterized OB-fold protein